MLSLSALRGSHVPAALLFMVALCRVGGLQGGGLYQASGSAKLINVTITNNTSGITASGGSLTGNNNIVAGNGFAGDIPTGTLVGGNNIVGTLSGLNLGPLANNGGPTQTVALLSGSTAAIGRAILRLA